MKMEELKRKMEAHIAAEKEANQVKQVPPVTVEGPDMAQLKQGLGSSNANLSQLAGGTAHPLPHESWLRS